MSQFMLLLRGGEFEQYSPEEMQKITEQYLNWAIELRDEGRFLAGDELKNGGRMLRAQNGRIVDGPFTETKEMIGGYYVIAAKDFAEATAIAQACPHLKFKGEVEIREIVPTKI